MNGMPNFNIIFMNVPEKKEKLKEKKKKLAEVLREDSQKDAMLAELKKVTEGIRLMTFPKAGGQVWKPQEARIPSGGGWL